MTILIESLNQWQTLRNTFQKNLSIGFVPTMGNLHAGHTSLLRRAKAENDLCILSIYVNQTQFNDKKDYENYPKTLQADLNLAEDYGIDYILMPNTAEIYPDEYSYRISEHQLSYLLEGKHRPGHFEGMLTIVMKLLLLVKPTKAYFGEKDYQQYLLIKGMVEAFFMQIEIIPCPTVRQDNGLALSSRNSLLSAESLKKAAIFAQYLQSDLSEDIIFAQLTAAGFEVDYIEKWQKRRFGAVKINQIRLIDNVALLEDNSVS